MKINIDQLYFAFILRQKGFQDFEIITVDNKIFFRCIGIDESILRSRRTERYVKMKIDDFFFTDPVQRGQIGGFKKAKLAIKAFFCGRKILFDFSFVRPYCLFS